MTQSQLHQLLCKLTVKQIKQTAVKREVFWSGPKRRSQTVTCNKRGCIQHLSCNNRTSSQLSIKILKHVKVCEQDQNKWSSEQWNKSNRCREVSASTIDWTSPPLKINLNNQRANVEHREGRISVFWFTPAYTSIGQTVKEQQTKTELG